MYLHAHHLYRWPIHFQVLGHLLSSHTSIPWQAPGYSHSLIFQHIPRFYRASNSLHTKSIGMLIIPVDQETLLYFATILADANGLQHGTILKYLYGVQALHINMGLSDPLRGALWLHKCLWVIHIQSNLESHKLAFMYNLLVLAWPLHQFPVQKVLWSALTRVHFGLLWTGEFMVDQEHFDPTQHLSIQDVTSWPYHPVRATIHYHPSSDQQDRPLWTRHWHDHWLLQHPSLQCLHCVDIIESHWVKQACPTAPFIQLSGQPLSRDIMVGHIKGLLAKLGLNPFFYSRHSLHIGGPITATAASLRD